MSLESPHHSALRPMPRNLRFVVINALITGPLRAHPGRTVLAIIAIALGVALGAAVHLINASALSEFAVAAHSLAGEADIVVKGPPAGFDEALYARFARMPEVAAANPAIELEAPLAGRSGAIKILGMDPLRAMQVQPALLPASRAEAMALLGADTVLISHAAAHWLGVAPGDAIAVLVGTSRLELRVAGLLPGNAYAQPIAVMDIARAQWRLDRLGRLNRIDLRVRPGVSIGTFLETLRRELPPGTFAATPDAEVARGASLTRAYRLNLDMLALVALFTGAFLIFSSQVLALLRRRSQFALLRVLGMRRGTISALLVAEGAVLGIIGSAAGLFAGYAIARYVVDRFGPDLGAGYFHSLSPALRVEPWTLAGYFLLGVVFALVGTAAPAVEAGRRQPAPALHAGDAEDALRSAPMFVPGLVVTGIGGVLAFAPPVAGLPLGGYGAVLSILIGFIMLLPRLAETLLGRLPRPRGPHAALAFAQLQATPRQVAIGVAAIVASFSLMVAMLIMVHSFRTSLEAWLAQMLPADLYLRVQRGGETGFLTPQQQANLATAPGVARIEFLRRQTLLLDPRRPAVALLAGREDAPASLPIMGSTIAPPSGAPPPIWISEVAADLYGWRVGDLVRLPLAGHARQFTVAGIWRDYARQSGAIVMRRSLYAQLSGDRLASDAAVWLDPGASLAAAGQALRERLAGAPGLEIAPTREVRANSLSIFDRTFAVTYALEAAAVLIGLFGISATFSAQAIARRREFGVLRHLGMRRRDIAGMLAREALIVSALGVCAGLALGWAVSLILVHVINRQSFHWTMEMAAPWPALGTLAAGLIAAAVATGVLSGRAAMMDDATRAVREDW